MFVFFFLHNNRAREQLDGKDGASSTSMIHKLYPHQLQTCDKWN
jgi:hypothetical protein